MKFITLSIYLATLLVGVQSSAILLVEDELEDLESSSNSALSTDLDQRREQVNKFVKLRAVAGMGQALQLILCTVVTYLVDRDPLATLGTGHMSETNTYGNFLISTMFFSPTASKLAQVLGVINTMILCCATKLESNFLREQLQNIEIKERFSALKVLKFKLPILPLYVLVMSCFFLTCAFIPMKPTPLNSLPDQNTQIHGGAAVNYVGLIFLLNVWYKRMMDELVALKHIKSAVCEVNLVLYAMFFFAGLNAFGMSIFNKQIGDYQHTYIASAAEWTVAGINIASYFGRKFYDRILEDPNHESDETDECIE